MSGTEIYYYTTGRGENPVKDFIDEHTISKNKVMHILDIIEKYGLLSAVPYTKKLAGTPLWEIKVMGQESVRILYVTRKSNSILLLHAFEKKTQKTPLKELALALKRMREFSVDN